MTTPICNKPIKLYNTTVKKATHLSHQHKRYLKISLSALIHNHPRNQYPLHHHCRRRHHPKKADPA